MNNFQTDLSMFSDKARVWLYIADRKLSSEESDLIKNNAIKFCVDWKSHGSAVEARSIWMEDQILLFIVDEEEAVLGGCSIDSSVRFVKEHGAHFGIDFFNRLLCAYRIDNDLKIAPVNELSKLEENEVLNLETLVYNTLIKTKMELENDFLIPLKKSWYARYLKEKVC